MNTVRVTTSCGESWSTRFNGTDAEARRYFLRQWFNIGPHPVTGDDDWMVQVTVVEWRPGTGTALDDIARFSADHPAESRAILDRHIAGLTDPDEVARLEIVREYLADPAFRRKLADDVFARTYPG